MSEWQPLTADVARITLRPDGEHPQEGRWLYDFALSGRFRVSRDGEGTAGVVDVEIEHGAHEADVTAHGATGQAIALEWWSRDGEQWVESVAPLMRWEADQSVWRGKGSQIWPGPSPFDPQAYWTRTLAELPVEVGERVETGPP